MFAFALTVLSFTTAAPIPPEGEEAKALKALQGRWKGAVAEERGEAGPIEDFDHAEGFAIDGATLILLSKGRKGEQLMMKFDRSKSPAHLDLTLSAADGTQHTCHAICKLEDNRLTICFSGWAFGQSEAKDRPTEFKTGPTEQRPAKGRLMYVFERVKN